MTCTILSLVLAATLSAPERPNIIWVMGEDMGPELSCYGHPAVRTPNFDRLAQDGTRYTQAFCTAPSCTPSRNAMMTGVYQTRTDTQDQRRRGIVMPDGIRPITHLLREAGYYTALGCGYSSKTDLNFKAEPLFDGKDWRKRQKGQPFFAQITLNSTHRLEDGWDEIHRTAEHPVDPAAIELPPYFPDHPVCRSDWARYLEAIQYIDGQMGDILDRLQREGIADETVVIFSGDNGQCHLRGKCWLYDAGIHVPLIIRWPGQVPAGRVSGELVSMIDVSATILDIAGVALPEYLDGHPILGDRAESRDHLFAARDLIDEVMDHIRCVRTMRFKYIRNYTPENGYRECRYVREHRPMYPVLKAMHEAGELNEVQNLLWQTTKPVEELYDLEADPFETRNLAGSPAHEETRRRLAGLLDDWIADTRDKGLAGNRREPYYWAGSPATVHNRVDGSTDVKLVWEEEKTNLGFVFHRPIEAETSYTGTFRIGQFGGKNYRAKPIELLLKARTGAAPWKPITSMVVSDMVLARGALGACGSYQLAFNTRDHPELIGEEEILLQVKEIESWTQGHIGGVSLAADKLPQDPPNIVFFLVDDLGWTDLGCFGSTFYETPNCNRLAEEGIRFTDAYAAAPVCSPSRVAIMTGKYPVRTGATDYFGCPTPERWEKRQRTKLLPARVNERLELSEVTLAEALQSGGYKTFFAGKWHCGDDPYWPQWQGFEINKGGWTRGGPYGGDKYFSPYGNPMLADGPKGEHLPDRLATETVRFIECCAEKPFFAFLSFYSVHSPLMSRPDLEKKYQEKRTKLGLETAWDEEATVWDIDTAVTRRTQDHAVYAGMIEGMDLAVGKVLNALDSLGLAEKTIVVFTSDNGGLSTAGSTWVPTSCLPLRAGKGWLYEGGIRVPAIIRWPGVVKPGGRCEVPIIGTDFYPTLLEAAGLRLRPRQHVDGTSLVPILRGGTIHRDALYWHYPHYGNQGGFPGSVLRQGDWKLIEKHEGGVELYHLKDDIGERHNLAEQEPERLRSMVVSLKQWQQEAGAVFPEENPSW